MTRRKTLIFSLLIFLESMAQVTCAFAGQRGSISGSLSNESHDSVSGAEVAVLGQGAVTAGKAVTDGAGSYVIELEPGSYTVTFSATGYKKIQLNNVVVLAGDTTNVSAILPAGSPTELMALGVGSSDDVSDGEEAVDADAEQAAAVKNLPLSSRNYTQAAGLASGVSSQVSNATAMGMNSQGVHVGSGGANNYVMDGASVASNTGGADSPAVPSPDAIEANVVQSWSYSAGPERHAGANISVVTRSGANAFHGTLFEFVRNDIFNANDFFLKRRGSPRPVLKQNQFGFSFGGPIKRDKAFFFMSYQGTRQRNGFAQAGFASSATLPPLPDVRNAATLGTTFCPANHPGDSKYTTLMGGVQVACNGSNINPVAINLLNLKLPDGSYLIPSSGSDTFQTIPRSIPASFQEDQVIFNTDLIFTSKHKLTERFFFGKDPQTSNFTGGSLALPGSPSTLLNGNIYGVLKLSSAFTDKFQNEIRLSGQHTFLNHVPQVQFTNDQAGIASIVPQVNMLDSVEISGLFLVGGTTTWDFNSVNQYQLADQASWMIGRHTMRFGFEIARRQWNIRVPGYARGSLSLGSFADFLLGLPGCPPGSATCSTQDPIVNGVATNGSAFSNIYGSIGAGGTVAYVTDPEGIRHWFRYSDASGYFQDEFRVLPRLTLSAGLRWEYFGLPSDRSGKNTNFWTSLGKEWTLPSAGGTYEGFVVPANFSGSVPAGVFRNDLDTPLLHGPSMARFAPRLNFSSQPFKESTVVRGGYGIFFDRPDAWLIEQQPMAAVPYAVPVGGAGQANYQASFPQPYQKRSLGWGTPRNVNFATEESTNLTLNVLDENFAAAMTQKWNFEIQQQFPKGINLVVGYAGAHSVRMQNATRQINVPRLASPEAPVNGIKTNTVKNAALRVPYLGIAANGLNSGQTQGSAKFNGLQVTISERARNGMRIQAAYMFSKTLTTQGAAPVLAGAPWFLGSTGMNSNNPLDAGQQYGRSSGSAPMRLALNYGWDFPWKKTGFIGKLANGWGFTGMTIMQAGRPMTVNDSRGGTIYGGAGVSRAQLCDGKTVKDIETKGSVKDRLNAYFNKSAFCLPPAIGDGTGFGSLGVGSILGPGQSNTDFAVKRIIELKRSRIELRAEFFNAFNHPQFSNPNTNVTDNPFGKISATSVNPRLIQFAAKYSF